MHISIILLLTWRAALFFLNILSLSIIFFFCKLESLIFSYIDKAIYVRTIHIWFPILVTPDIINIHWWDTYLAQYMDPFLPWNMQYESYTVTLWEYNNIEKMNILKNIAENFSATHMNPILLNSSFFHVPMDVHCKLILLFVNEYKRHIENFLNGLLPPLLACIWPFN